MGRSYREELTELATAQESVPDATVVQLRAQAALAANCGLIVVASGGAKVVSEWACRLQRTIFGSAAVAMTPLEYASLAAPVRAATWFLSAGGRHPDIRYAASVARDRGDARVIGFIGHQRTPLGEWLKTELKSEVIEFDLPTGGDGFLATTSVWAMACALAKTYAAWISPAVPLDGAYFDKVLAWGAQAALETPQTPSRDQDTVILHDAWTALGANDLETRFIETALGNLWSTDFRNFGHGRHFWIDDRRDRTSLFAIWTPASEALAKPTLELLPSNLAAHQVQVPFDGIAGALAALSWSIHLTANRAEHIGRDPGRPGVKKFGEQLYEGGFPYPQSASIDDIQHAIQLKSSAIQPGTPLAADWEAAYWRARKRFETAAVSAIASDYDGTLVDSAKRWDPPPAEIVTELIRLLEGGVFLGIATGRGNSVQEALRKVIPEAFWSQVIVGYHNGAEVLNLGEPIPDLDREPTEPPLSLACEVLQQELEKRGIAKLKCRRNQLTVMPSKGLPLLHAWRATRECLDRNGLGSTSVWLSSHSVDVLGPRCSKINVVNRVAELAGCPQDAVLRIGDRGSRPGNDWQMLTAPLGVSVGDCSSDMETCWNLLPPGLHGANGTAYLLRKIKVAPGGNRGIVGGAST